jgi:nicotinamide riboside kinase
MSKPVKVLFTGPESCGKTTLSQWLHEQTGWNLVPEAAREYLSDHGPGYTEYDLLAMSRLQWSKECNAASIGGNTICDTDLLTYMIWQEERFGRVDSWIQSTWQSSLPDICFLCMPDIPWEADPLRENALDRDRLALAYERMLHLHSISYFSVYGPFSERKEAILATLQKSIIQGMVV